MARNKKVVDGVKLKEIVQKLETERTFINRTDLYAAVCDTSWAKTLNLTPGVVYLRIKEFKINVKTPLGKKGNPNLGTLDKTARKKRTTGTNVKKALTTAMSQYGELGLADKILGGSLKAAIRGKCIDCTNGDKKEITNCVCVDCALYIFRPFRKNDNEDTNKEVE